MKVNGYKVELRKLSPEDGGGFVALVPELPGCSSAGDTEADAVAGIGEAIEGWIVLSLRFGHEIPCASKRSVPSRASDKAHAA